MPAPEYPRDHLVAALVGHSDAAIELLLPMLDDSDALARTQAAELLGYVGHARAAELVPVLVRWAERGKGGKSDAYPAIARLAPSQVVPLGLLSDPLMNRGYLLSLLREPERGAALDSLFEMGSARATDAAVGALSALELVMPRWREQLVLALSHESLDSARLAQRRLLETDVHDVLASVVAATTARPTLLTERSAAAVARHSGAPGVLTAALEALPGDMDWSEEQLLKGLAVLAVELRRQAVPVPEAERWARVLTRCLARPGSTRPRARREMARGEFVLGASARLAGAIGDPRLLDVLLAELGRTDEPGFAYGDALAEALSGFTDSATRLMALQDDLSQPADVCRRARSLLVSVGLGRK